MSLGHAFYPIGPLISPDFVPQPIQKSDVIIASIVWSLTLIWAGICGRQIFHQIRITRFPLKSTFVWMISIELVVCVVMGTECWLHLMKVIPPSFAFYFTILTWWCIQVQLLLQIIINRVRVISLSRERAKAIMIATAVFVTLINISVFNIWIPARLQTSKKYIRINDVWDRCEKVIYLILDACLNAYFIKTVKKNLVHNGLQKYDKLLKFNMRIILVSLMMDVMIIAAMSIPNSFVYIQFHPLAYLVKLNIEITMAHLIKKIAISSAKRSGNRVHAEFIEENDSSNGTHCKNSNIFELTTSRIEGGGVGIKDEDLVGIHRTREISIHSEQNPDMPGSAISETDSASQVSKKEDQQHVVWVSSDGSDDDEKPFATDSWTGTGQHGAAGPRPDKS